MGRVLEINVTAEHGGKPRSVAHVEAVAERGLKGDRYFDSGKPDKAVTLIAREALDHLASEFGISLSAAASGRNILTEGIDLNQFVGKTLRVGAALVEGFEWCEPCKTLEKRTQDGVLKGLLHRGGLRARILETGDIGVGDTIEAMEC